MTPDNQKWTENDIPFAQNKSLHYMIVLLVIFFGAMAISPTDRVQWFAESTGLVVIILILVFTYKRVRFSNLSYFLLLIFFCLLIYASHYTFERTPFDLWLKYAFHTKRSYYDRVVHFSFGLLLVYPILEFLKHKVKVPGIWPYILAASVILGFSVVFEVMEMLAALVTGTGGESRFVGMQGDVYDTQKDMGLAFIGVILAIGTLAWIRWREAKN